MAVGKKTGGRRKGTPNKVTASVKEALLQSFENVGGVSYLDRMAAEEPRAYMALLNKVIPAEVKQEITKKYADLTLEELMEQRQRMDAEISEQLGSTEQRH